MAGYRFVHRIVEDLGRQMVQRPFVGAADIHAWPPPDGLQPLKNLDILGGIGLGRGALIVEKVGRVFGHGKDTVKRPNRGKPAQVSAGLCRTAAFFGGSS